MKWLIVEDALKDRKGHWLEYVSTFVDELQGIGDEVDVLCDCRAQGFVMEQTRARPVLPESIWHRMGDGAGALQRYLRVPGHAMATFFAMRKFFKKFNHRGHGDHGVGGKREIKCETGRMNEAQCNAQEICAGAFESDSLTSKLAESPVSESPIRSANGPASSPVTSHSLQALTPEASLPATSYSLPATSSPPDWIFVPTVLVHHLLGWWMLLITGSLPGNSRVLLFFPNLPIRLDDAGQPHWMGGPTTKLMAWLFENLRGVVQSGKVVLGVETHAMRRALEGLIRMPVVYLPHPVLAKRGREEARAEERESLKTEDIEGTQEGEARLRLTGQAGVSDPELLTSKRADSPVSESPTRSASGSASLPDTSDAPRATSAEPIVFGCYGAARWEKGSDILQAAIRRVLEEHPAIPARFAFQWIEDFNDEHGRRVTLDSWVREHPKVEVIERYFDDGEINLRLSRTDLMVLPYRAPYRLRVSRVVIEAMLHGMPVIATEGTTLYDQANAHGCGLGCEEGSVEGLAKRILEAAANFETLQLSARAKIPDAERNFSVDCFRQLLINLKINKFCQ